MNSSTILLAFLLAFSFASVAEAKCEDEVSEAAKGVTCEACQLVMRTLEAIITDPDNELAIANALDEVCSLMPDFFVEECHFMICTYYDELINLAVSEYGDPEELCELLTLCP